MRSITQKKTVLFLLLTALFLLQDKLQDWFTPFQYFDEFFAILVVPLLLLRILQKRSPLAPTKKTILFFTLLAVFWICGWLGYFVYRYQPLQQTAMDSYVNLKFFMAFGAAFLLFDDDRFDLQEFKKILWPVLNGITVILFVLCVIDRIFGVFSDESRGVFRAVKLFYSSYTVLAAHCVLLCAMYLLLFDIRKKQIIPPLLMLSFVLYCTRRVKAIGAIACLLMVYLLILRKRHTISRKVKIFAGCILLFAAAAGIYQLISYYIVMGTESARAMLTVASPFVALDHFPFGSGWGTFGSAFSVDPYSPVYGMYRMAGIWGISPNYNSFVSDTYWPMLLAECGYFGFAAFIGALILFVQKIVQSLKKDGPAFASAVLVLLYLLISSTSESALANPLAVPLAFWLGILIAAARNRVSDPEEEKI